MELIHYVIFPQPFRVPGEEGAWNWGGCEASYLQFWWTGELVCCDMSGCLSSHFVFHLSLKGLFKLPTKVAFFLHDFNVGLLFIYLFISNSRIHHGWCSLCTIQGNLKFLWNLNDTIGRISKCLSISIGFAKILCLSY